MQTNARKANLILKEIKYNKILKLDLKSYQPCALTASSYYNHKISLNLHSKQTCHFLSHNYVILLPIANLGSYVHCRSRQLMLQCSGNILTSVKHAMVIYCQEMQTTHQQVFSQLAVQTCAPFYVVFVRTQTLQYVSNLLVLQCRCKFQLSILQKTTYTFVNEPNPFWLV